MWGHPDEKEHDLPKNNKITTIMYNTVYNCKGFIHVAKKNEIKMHHCGILKHWTFLL